MRSDILVRPAHEIAALVRWRAVSAREIAEAAIASIEEQNPQLGAFTDFTFERALAAAEAVDHAVFRGQAPPLAGVPYAVKNLFDVTGLVTRAGSRINRDNPPAAVDATLVRRFEASGGILLGALNMGEYAYDFTGENVHDGHARNPHDPSRMAGGSSGGSAAAVASGMVAVSLGSDTNGSIRVPAAFCGLFGLKPSFGRLSRAGAFPFSASFDHVGPLARSARDIAAVFDALQGDDAADPAQVRRPALATLPEIDKGLQGLRIAVAGGYFQRGVGPQALAALAIVAEALGASREVELPEAHRARAAAFVITQAEGANLHLDRVRRRAADFDPMTRDRLLAGAMMPASWLIQAQRFRSWFRERLRELFEKVDVILAPVTPLPALPIGTTSLVIDGVEVPVRANIGILTQPLSFIGLPVVAVPVWLDGADLPVGVQVIAPAWREDIALRVAHYLETVRVCGALLPRKE